MFSSTTIASSTTKPVEMVSAISDRLSRLKPSRYIAANVPMIDTGTAMLGMSVARAVAQEHEDHQDDQHTEMTSVRSVSASEVRMVCERSIATVRSTSPGSEAAMRGSSRLHRVDGVDDVGAGLAIDDDQHRRLAVGEAGVAEVLDRIDDLADIGQLHRGAVAVGDHQIAVFGGVAGLVVGVDLVMAVAVLDRALRAVGVGRGERRAHVLEADAVFEQRGRD